MLLNKLTRKINTERTHLTLAPRPTPHKQFNLSLKVIRDFAARVQGHLLSVKPVMALGLRNKEFLLMPILTVFSRILSEYMIIILFNLKRYSL